MSKINYQALREAAEKATWGDWDSYKPHRGARGYEVRLSSQAIAQHVLKNNAEFIAAFNPKIALALLDERERNQQYIKSRDQENEDIALTVWELRVELEAANERIAELEAREVVRDEMTPKQASRSYCGEVLGYRDGWNACRAAMIQCADGSIAHEGKNNPEDKLGMVDHFGGSNNMVEPVTDNTNQQFESLSRGDK